MAHTYPQYLHNTGIDTSKLTFFWDDWKESEANSYDPGKMLALLSKVSITGRLTLGTGIMEWISYRFSAVNDDNRVEQIIEAGWCGIVDPHYMQYTEFDSDEWLGPVRGPLWCAMTWYISMIFYEEQGDEEIEDGLDLLIKLAMHIIPNPQIFEQWLDKCISRMLALYPYVEEDPFSNLFGEEDRGGPLVSREVLDVDKEYDPAAAEKSIDTFLRNVDYKSNPFLNTPEVMRENGFEGTPYRL